MKVAIVLAVLCIAPAVLGQIDVDAIFGNFQRPYKCGQCISAFAEAKNQICGEIDVTIPFFDFKGACKELLKLVGGPVAQAFCTPFGLCKGAGKNAPIVSCANCPAAAETAFRAICGFFPDIPLFNPRESCNIIVDRFAASDFNYVCGFAGFC